MKAGWTFARSAVHGWTVLTAVLTFLLLCSGGLVTSHGVGMAVPDWPNTFGYNMFAFPFSRWVGGIFYEHSHRLIATFVGLFTAVLAGAFWVRETHGGKRTAGLVAIGLVLASLGARVQIIYLVLGVAAFLALVACLVTGFRTPGSLRWFGMAALCAVVIQGILGGLRVVWFKDEIGIFHGMLAQSFFAGLILLCILTSRRFFEGTWADYEPHPTLRWWALGATLLIFLQLGLGATMRHEHIGLSIPDFPLAYGKILPDTSPDAIEAINAVRAKDDQMPTNAVQIWIQMVHRFVAVAILAAVVMVAVKARRSARAIRGRAGFWVVMILAQVGLGAWTIWSNKAADIATAHMALGALSLAWGVALTFRLLRGARTSDFALPDAARQRLMEVTA